MKYSALLVSVSRITVVLVLVVLTGAAVFLYHEVDQSRVQASELHRWASRLHYDLATGPSDRIRFPTHGPFDERLGYTRIPAFAERLTERGFEITRQSRHSAALMAYQGRGLFPPYAEKSQAGLTVLDCQREPIYAFRYPYRQFDSFDSIPSVLVQALLFIENRDLLDEHRPYMNPAVDWVRFTRAVLGQLGSKLNPEIDAPGGSTLATQVEKYRHSPDGITYDAREKLRQMVSAAVRAYRSGEQTLPVRRQLVLDYMNTVPLSAAPRHGEVNGLGDGLWVWFGTNPDRARRLLAPDASSPERPEPVDPAERAQVLRQAVALMIAHRRPSWYLAQGRQDLDQSTDAHLRILAAGGIIDAATRDEALRQRLVFRDMVRNPPLSPVEAGKGTVAVRNRLAGLLDTSLYSLDRLDARLQATLHGQLQSSVTDFLGRLTDPTFVRDQGLLGERLLKPGNFNEVRYSFTLWETTPKGNQVRVQTDTTDQPLDINEGSKLELGSTAKLRVLTTYLELVAELHQRLAPLAADELRATEVERLDTLTRWGVDHLLQTTDRSLNAMLQAALNRRFSASPGEGFFTGGGVHTFNNFNRDDNSRNPTLREAMQASINLPFVRLMREVVRHTMVQLPGSTARLLQDASDPRRDTYLARFADREGQIFVRRFWRKTEGRSADELRAMAFDGLGHSTDRLAAVYRYLEPEASPQALAVFLADQLGESALSADRIFPLYQRFAPDAMDLQDRGYVARLHPLELWVVAYRLRHPQATLPEAIAASAEPRQEVYRWLFQTRAKNAQDNRIQTMLEVEAFGEIHRRWARLGYPFGQLVPSLATALGSSGDRPGALVELMGIIVNDGVRLPPRRIDNLLLAQHTPWETEFQQRAVPGERVLPVEVARALRGALSEVVERGTARRLSGSFRGQDGADLTPGGKPGTGDNRVVVKGRSTYALNRTATFVFYIGPHHFGSITAYVVGPNAAQHNFTSGLPVQILRAMGPLLMPHLDPARPGGCPVPQEPPTPTVTPSN